MEDSLDECMDHGAFLESGEPNVFWGAIDMEDLRRHEGEGGEMEGGRCGRFVGLLPFSTSHDGSCGDSDGYLPSDLCCHWAFRWSNNH